MDAKECGIRGEQWDSMSGAMETTAERYWPRMLANMPWSFIASFLVHGLALVVMAAVALPNPFTGTALLSLMMAEASPDETLTAEDFVSFELGSEAPVDSTSESDAVTASTLTGLAASDTSLPSEFGSELAEVAATDASFLQQVQEAMSSRMGSGPRRLADGAGAYYFGVEAVGERFAFVIDSSRSMVGRRWNSAIYELQKSLNNLAPDQRFSVICFDGQARPALDVPAQYFAPTKKELTRIVYWMKSLQNGRNTYPAVAIEMALALKPDAIFILSDGELQDDSQELLLEKNRNADGSVIIPVHTISLFSDEGKETLRAIASENRGTFTDVD